MKIVLLPSAIERRSKEFSSVCFLAVPELKPGPSYVIPLPNKRK
jgi:hypothetical protein